MADDEQSRIEESSKKIWTVFYDPHRGKKGKKTAELARKLADYLGNQEPERCHPTPCMGKYSLSWADIVVADKRNKKVKVICEIEESRAGAAPKVVIGDIVNVLLSNEMRIKGKRYTYDNLCLIVGISDKRRDRAEKLEEMVRERVQPVSTIEFDLVFGKTLDELISEVRKKIFKIINIS